MRFTDYYNNMHKKGAALLTPEAQQAAAMPPPPPQGAPMDPSMMGGAPAGAPPMDPSMMGGMPPQGAPMDPSMMGGAPMPPQGGMSMDPSMGGMPPQGAPMDPSMQGGAPMDPSMMPPPGAWMQDQGFMMMLQQMGVIVDPNTGTVTDPNGQPIDPAMLDQMYAQYLQEAAAQGIDPAMIAQQAGQMPQEGMPQEGAPEEQGPMLDEQTMNEIASVVTDAIGAQLDDALSQMDKKISAFMEKLDTIKIALDDLALNNTDTNKKLVAQQKSLNDQLEQELKNQQAQEQPVVPAASEASQGAPTPQASMLDIMRGV